MVAYVSGAHHEVIPERVFDVQVPGHIRAWVEPLGEDCLQIYRHREGHVTGGMIGWAGKWWEWIDKVSGRVATERIGNVSECTPHLVVVDGVGGTKRSIRALVVVVREVVRNTHHGKGAANGGIGQHLGRPGHAHARVKGVPVVVPSSRGHSRHLRDKPSQPGH